MIPLKNVLRINALSSGATGAGMIMFGNAISNLFGISQPQPFWAVGFFLIGFGIMVFKESIREHPGQHRVKFIVVLDLLWVAGSIVIVAFQLFDLSLIGYSSIAAVAVWVGLMAYLQITALKKISV